MDRQHRRELKHDRFVDEIGTLSFKARQNQRLLLALTLGILAVGLIGFGIYFYRSNREQQAQAALGTAIDVVDSPLIQPVQPGQPPQQQDPRARYRTDAERNKAAEDQFHAVQKNFSGTDAADVANLYLARMAGSRGEAATAKKLLQDFINEHPKHVLVAAARYSLYQMRIDNGEAPQVVTELNQELAKPDNQILPGDSMLALLAHAYDVQGSADKSKDAYRRIIQQFPDSPYALEAQRRVGGATT